MFVDSWIRTGRCTNSKLSRDFPMNRYKLSLTRNDHSLSYAKSKRAVELDAASIWILIVAVEAFMLNSLVFPVASESPKGFVSIDSGGLGGWDPITTLDWEGDRKYLQAADQLKKEGVAVNAKVTLARSSTPVANAERTRLETALVFYPGKRARTPRSKYCYNLSVEFSASGSSKKYLLRATFPSRNLTAKDINGEFISFSAYTTRFYFSVDSTYLSTVDLDELHPQTIEVIITSFTTNVYVCLIPLEDRSSMPAISGLELRPLNDGMYRTRQESDASGVQGETSYLMAISRLNFGGDPTLPSLRYPSDKYDRLWSSPPIPSSQSTDVMSVRNTSHVNTFGMDEAGLPEAVMSTAWEGRSLESNISFEWNLTEPRPQRPMLTFQFNFMFCDILDTSDATRFMDIDYDQGKGSETFYHGWTISDGWSLVYSTNWVLNGDVISFTISTNSSSDLAAMINTAEIYGELNSVTGRTVEDDAVAVGDFALEFPDHLDGSGDPCLPVPWAWIVCSIEVPPRVTQINLTSKGVGKNLPLAFGKLDRLTVLDLSNNSFRGSVPSALGNISALRVLNLEGNELTGELPTFIAETWQNLEFLSLSYNQFSGNLASLVSALDDTLTVLKLSNNSFSGNVPIQIERLTKLENLDLSNNELSGTLGVDLVKLKSLRTLNLNNNNLVGTVPDNLWNTSNPADLEVNLGGNKFTELNLTTWYTYVIEEKSFDAGKSRRKVRLLGNQIHDIILPSLPPLETKITSPQTEDEQKLTLENPAAFILLADNPWCEVHGGPNAPLLERYLCRSDEKQNFWSPPPGEDSLSKTTVILVVVICGLVVALMVCLSAFFLWRMGRRTLELRQIQEALAKEHVKPPFFDYDNLKLATQNFSSYNILGSGGFGTVYKAELSDRSILAVKKLTPTEQNTSDFLKEMVNISGIKHKHLIQLKGCCVREKQRMLVYEYAENRSLAEALWGTDALFLSWNQRLNICLGIARGLAYLHDELHPTMVHRDIKPQNILLDKDYNAKIADFGLVRPAEADNCTQVTVNIGGTRAYCSPEYLTEGVISEKLDVFSYGVVVLEIVSGRVCINLNLPRPQIYLRTWAMELYEEDKLLNMVDKGLMDEYNQEEVLLILHTALACCQLDSKKRPTMSQVVNVFMKLKADVAIDIVKELRGQKPQLDSIVEDDIEDHACAVSPKDEAEGRALISLNSANSSHFIELSDMSPR